MLIFSENSASVSLTQLRMDNQWSEALREVALELDIHIEFISTESKRANRAERAIRTAKNQIVATRAGFHPDFSHAFLDKCLPQMELALNVIHPFEYDDNISAYEGIHRAKFDFKRHPIAPLECKVLTWDALENRGSWADHGIEGMYIGSFNIWVPSTSALRIANTVWWFMASIKPSQEFLQLDLEVAYLPTRNRPDPQNNGFDIRKLLCRARARCVLYNSIGSNYPQTRQHQSGTRSAPHARG